MNGVSVEQATIEMNLAEMINPVARRKGCQAFPANLRLKVPAVPTYRYPDLSLVCGKVAFVEISGLQCLANPVLIIEVLSDSTESYDRGDKFREYKSIKSFTKYLLISSNDKNVTLYQKHNGCFWLQSDYITGESFHLNTLEIDMKVDDLYQEVEFPQQITNE